MGKLNAIDTGSNYFDRDIYLSYFNIGSSQLKRDAFLFDHLIIPGVKDFLNLFPSHFAENKKNMSELVQDHVLNYFDNIQYLFDLEYIIDPGFDINTLINSGANFSECAQKEPLYYFDLIEVDGDLKYANKMPYVDTRNEVEIIKHSYEILKNNDDTLVVGNPILLTTSDQDVEQNKSDGQEIMNVILSDISMPSQELVWDDIFELKSDKDLRNSFHKLRMWIKKAVSTNRNPSDLIDEYLDLRNDYEKYMTLTNKKISNGLFESLVTISAEILENFVKLKFKNLAQLPFLIKNNRLKIQLEEFNAPGREVGYTYKISQKLNGK